MGKGLRSKWWVRGKAGKKLELGSEWACEGG